MSGPKDIDALSPAEKRALLQRLLQEKARANKVRPGIEAGPFEAASPLSFLQEGMWFLQQLEPASPAYNETGTAELLGPLDLRALERSFTALFERHHVLRATFPVEGGVPVQRIGALQEVRIPVEDLPGGGGAEGEARLRARVHDEANTPFDLARGPLVRLALLRMGPERHILLINIHHIITDGWSFSILVRELVALYSAFVEGRQPELEAPRLQYADFARWQRTAIGPERITQQLAFWKERLAAAPALELPTDHPRPPVRTNRGEVLEAHRFDPALSESIRRMAQREGVTAFMFLEAATKVLLHRYTGQTDLSFGASFVGRERDTEQVFGLFANTLVLRSDLSGDPDFRELLGRVRKSELEALARQDVPFDKVVEAVNPPRDLSRTPLFQVLYDTQKAPQVFRAGALELRPLQVLNATSKTDLAFLFVEEEAALSVVVVFSRDLFERETIERMVQQLEILLAGIVARPDERISRLPLLPAPERQRLLVEWNRTDTPQRHLCLHHGFEAQARRTPELPALSFDGGALSYAELDARANQLAHLLRARGVGPETIVGVCVERGPWLITSILGVLKAGAAYLPLDAELPVERLELILDDALAPVLLTQSGIRDELGRTPPFTLCLDELEDELEAQPDGPTGVEVGPQNLAYVIYTSGSTGRPKGVLVEHRGPANAVQDGVERLAVSPGRNYLQFLSIGFDVSVWEVFSVLSGGGTLVLASKDRLMPGPELEGMIRTHQIRALVMPPSVLATLPADALPSVDRIVTGGEAPSPALIERWVRGGRVYFNAYGPTETSIAATTARCEPGEDRPSIGGPNPNVRVYVLDAHLEPVPIGVPGELYVGGEGVGRGYLNQPALTAERFLPDPFHPEPGRRMYKTGDRVRFRPDGRLEFIGRDDHQVKVRGFRIELGEIEAVLCAQPGIREAAVVLREDAPGDKRLVAYVRASEGVRVSSAALREGLARTLPDYMVPSAFVALEAFPLTPNGKLDRRALPAPERVGEGGDEEIFVAPRTDTERRVAELWAQVLSLPQVGVTENFFEIGGHSLLAAQLASLLREAFGLEIPVRVLFERATVAELAGWIDAHAPSAAPAALRPRLERNEAPPTLSYAQEFLLRAERTRFSSPVFTVVDLFRLRGELDPALLGAAFQDVVNVHEILRTGFDLDGPWPALRIGAVPGAAQLEYVDLREVPEAQREGELQRRLEGFTGEGFDLASASLVRAACFRIAEDAFTLVLCAHALVADGTTHDVLLSELLDAYERRRRGAPGQSHPEALRYADYAAWQRRWLEGERLDSELGYWREALAGAPDRVRLPFARPHPHPPSPATAFTRRLELEAGLSDRLRELCRSSACTPFTLFQALFGAWLLRHDDRGDFVIGVPVLGRDEPATARLMGPLIQLVPERVRVQPGDTLASLIDATHRMNVEALEHGHVPFGLVVEALGAVRESPLRLPLFNVLFSMHHPPPARADASVEVERLGGRSGAAKVDLALRGFDDGARFGFEFEYDPDVLGAARVSTMLEDFVALLARAAAHPEGRVGDLLEGSR